MVKDRSALWINLESTGRDAELAEMLHCDLTRTVGWLTALYPILMNRQPTLKHTIQHAHEILKNIPMGGIGYSLAKQANHPKIAHLPTPQILFNFFGKVEKDLLTSGILQPCEESFGPIWDPQNERPYLLETNALISQGKLQMEIESHREFFTIEEHNQFQELFTLTLESIQFHLDLSSIPSQ
jgi:non-ribosomal peptide synthase protein (TIGR01720 family)